MFTSVVQNQENLRKIQEPPNMRRRSSVLQIKRDIENKKDFGIQEYDLEKDRDELETRVLISPRKKVQFPEADLRNREFNINQGIYSFANEKKEMKKTKTRKIKEQVLGKFNSFIFKEKVQKSKKNNYVKTKKSEFLYYQFCYNTFLQCIFSISSIFSSILSYEIEYNKKNSTNTHLDISLWFSFFSSIGLWVTIIYEYFISCKILALSKNLPEKIWRKETNNIFSVCITILLFFLHPNPVLKGYNLIIYNEKYKINTTHSWNSILTVICLLRMWYFVKFYLVYSDYYSPRTQRICQMNNFDTNLTFSMKANMVKTPYHAYLLLFIIVLMYCSFCLRIFERVLDDPSGKNFSSYWNAVWCLIITMTTVGYGDYFPSTTLGRTIGIVSCICGVFLISMLIVTITNVLNFQGTEENVFLILKRLKLNKEKDQLAAKLISKYMAMMKILKKSSNEEENFQNKEKLRREILLGLFYFKEKSKEIEATFPAYSDFDIIIDNLELLDSSMNNLQKKYEILEKNIESIARKAQ